MDPSPTSQARIPVTSKAVSPQLLLLGSSLLQLERQCPVLLASGSGGDVALLDGWHPADSNQQHRGWRQRAPCSWHPHIPGGDNNHSNIQLVADPCPVPPLSPPFYSIPLSITGRLECVTQQYFRVRQQNTNAHHKAPRQH